MSNITTRSGKGSPLTHTELDANFSNLNTDKLENITGESIGSLSDVDLSSNTDGYVLTYNSTSGNIELQAAAGGGASTGDWVFSGNNLTTNLDTSYTTIRPVPYRMEIGNGSFGSDWTASDPYNGLQNANWAIAESYDIQSNGRRFYNTAIESFVNHTLQNCSDRGRSLNLQQIETGKSQGVNGSDTNMYQHRTIQVGHEWDPSYGDTPGATLQFQSAFATYIRNRNGGQVGYQVSAMLENQTNETSTTTQTVGLAFTARNNTGNTSNLNRYYAIHNYANGNNFNGGQNNGGINDNVREASIYYFIRNEDDFASNRVGSISSFHEELKTYTISSDTTETLGIWGGGDTNSFTNTVHFELQANYTLSGLAGLFVGDTVQSNSVKTKYAADTATLIFEQDSTGGRTVTLPTGPYWKYANGNSTVGTTAGSTTIVTISAIDPGASWQLGNQDITYLVSISPEFVGS